MITPTPTYRTINPLIYNGLPAGLIALIGGPPAPVGAPVPIGNDGIATILNVAEAAPVVDNMENDYDVPFNQVIPKPFCASGPQDFVHLLGTVRFEHEVRVTSSGVYDSDFRARGSLTVTPFDPFSSPPGPVGPSYQGEVTERYSSLVTEHQDQASMTRSQRLFVPGVGPLGSLKLDLRVGPSDRFDLDVTCDS